MSSGSQVRVINIKPISEEFYFQQEKQQKPNHDFEDSKYHQKQREKQKQKQKDNKKTQKHLIDPKGNFSFEHSYPAVIFDQVCFSVDRSSQQSNFLNELLCRISSCFDFSSLSTAKNPEATSNKINKNKVEILKSINLNVPYGSIFGLLGPSSCGKTTLLRCLVGLLTQTSGSICLFGHNNHRSTGSSLAASGSCCCNLIKSSELRNEQRCNEEARAECKVPGRNVGYMPQDLGLYQDFTISQLLTMFGRYMSMKEDLIAERIQFMSSFLDLPDVNREIVSLSGGQKRRVSFAVACLHMPPLIILDEPTVGVDPLLRQSIWKYLRRLADEENKTIIITTHYIEEAAQADQVALMRAGEILVQDSPKKIMELNGSKTLEEAFLKICNNVSKTSTNINNQKLKLYPQPTFKWHDKEDANVDNVPDRKIFTRPPPIATKLFSSSKTTIKSDNLNDQDQVVRELKQKAQEKLDLFDLLYSEKNAQIQKLNQTQSNHEKQNQQQQQQQQLNNLSFGNNSIIRRQRQPPILIHHHSSNNLNINFAKKARKIFTTNDYDEYYFNDQPNKRFKSSSNKKLNLELISNKLKKLFRLGFALLYKNYRRNVNSLPLLAFQFLLPIVQMISFSLCVGGRPTDIALGLINNDQLPLVAASSIVVQPQFLNNSGIIITTNSDDPGGIFPNIQDELLSDSYLSFIDTSMLTIKPYPTLEAALADVRRAKLWAAMEIGENFTTTILQRFDLENFYQLDTPTIKQSVIKIYPDRSNKVLDMICQRSLMNSYRKFLLSQFEHFKRLPIEVKEPIFEIEPNLISNSIDGYTESIAAGLLASLTYIMAAGLTTFIMVVERGNGILERTYTSGINPVAYLLAHALFRSFVMMLQIAVVMILTFYVLRQPLVGSIWLAYLILMTLNLTGISYGLLVSSFVTDQNGAALTIVSSLVVKITMSGILWPFEAIPKWLRVICYAQPLTMPVQALKAITLKGASMEDKAVYLGFTVSLTWMVLFLTIAAKRFKFYQH